MSSSRRSSGERPVATLVVPMLNELAHIDDCLDGFAAQTYPHELLDVVVVDGGSDDGSRQHVEARAATEPWLRVVDNPARKAAAAFNVGVEQAKGDVVFLFSAHGVPDPDFVERTVEVLSESGADGVGGRYLHVGTDPVSSAIGLAMVSPFGMASPHRHAGRRQEVDTISHPGYRADSLARVGRFDETLERNSDYELNHRMRELGMTLLFDPSIVSIYRPRPSLRALGRQFWWYGRWKARVVERHPRSLKARHLVAPAATVGLALVPALSCSRRGRRVVGLGAAAYAALAVTSVGRAHPADHGANSKVLLACFPVMHVSWGAGFLTSVIEDLLRRVR
ncbi:MAG: glycosyltransferase family 2 protein [Acidimicrobiales bacterium]